MNRTLKNILIVLAIIGVTILAFKAIATSISYGLSSAADTISDAYGTKCEKTANSWIVGKYEIQEHKCIGWAGPPFYPLSLIEESEIIDKNGYRIDSCKMHFQPKKDIFLKLDICNETITELRPSKELLSQYSIDSIQLFSKERNRMKKLSQTQISRFVKDWNNSRLRGYSDEPFDSAFSSYPAYQYRLTIFSNEEKRYFYAYNYLLLDNNNWEYEMSETANLEYIHEYWNE